MFVFDEVLPTRPAPTARIDGVWLLGLDGDFVAGGVTPHRWIVHGRYLGRHGGEAAGLRGAGDVAEGAAACVEFGDEEADSVAADLFLIVAVLFPIMAGWLIIRLADVAAGV